MKPSTIEETFLKPCLGRFEAIMIGGSTLYSLNTPESDVDYRGVYTAHDPKYIAGFSAMDSVVLDPNSEHGIDATFYSLRHWMRLLQKTNTQVMEMLFAPDRSFIHKTMLFDLIRHKRESFVDSERLKASLRGYIFSEMRLATGERSGQLGGKRKAAVASYGFSPKNFVQIIRLCHVGIRFFSSGEYMVSVADDPKLQEALLDIKLRPERYTCEELSALVRDAQSDLDRAMERSEIRTVFDADLASEIIIESTR